MANAPEPKLLLCTDVKQHEQTERNICSLL